MGYKPGMQISLKYCPACGRPGFAPGRRCECPACGFVYFHNAAAAVALILEVEDKILLTRRALEPGWGRLDLPGGFIEPGETAEEGLRRELGEELGLVSAELNYLCSLPNRYPWGGVEYRTLDLFFVARLESLEGLRPSGEIAAVELVEPAAIALDELAFDSIRRGLEFYLRTFKISG